MWPSVLCSWRLSTRTGFSPFVNALFVKTLHANNNNIQNNYKNIYIKRKKTMIRQLFQTKWPSGFIKKEAGLVQVL